MNTAQFERIEAYLNQRLSIAEKQAFEAEIEANTVLQAELQTQQQLRLGLRALGIEKQLANAKKRQAAENTTVIKRGFWGKNQWKTWAAAASVVLVLGLGWWVWQQNDIYKDTQLMALAEREMTDIQYKSMPFESLQNLSKTTISVKTRQKAEWYVALGYLRNGKRKESKTILKRIANEPQHLYHKQAKGLLRKM